MTGKNFIFNFLSNCIDDLKPFAIMKLETETMNIN